MTGPPSERALQMAAHWLLGSPRPDDLTQEDLDRAVAIRDSGSMVRRTSETPVRHTEDGTPVYPGVKLEWDDAGRWLDGEEIEIVGWREVS